MEKRLERILPRVQKPARYVGGEYNQVVKDKAQVALRSVFRTLMKSVCPIWACGFYMV